MLTPTISNGNLKEMPAEKSLANRLSLRSRRRLCLRKSKKNSKTRSKPNSTPSSKSYWSKKKLMKRTRRGSQSCYFWPRGVLMKREISQPISLMPCTRRTSFQTQRLSTASLPSCQQWYPRSLLRTSSLNSPTIMRALRPRLLTTYLSIIRERSTLIQTSQKGNNSRKSLMNHSSKASCPLKFTSMRL